jgi:hypothetical protein
MGEVDVYKDMQDLINEMELKNTVERRTVIKPLYDYFQRLLRDIAVRKCGLDENTIKNTHLKVRWANVKACLECIEDPTVWDELINRLQKIRSSVEHDDYADPKKRNIEFIKEKIPEFTRWIIDISHEYHKKSLKFTFKESFYARLHHSLRKAESIIYEYSMDDSGSHPINLKDDYAQLKDIIQEYEDKIDKFNIENDLDKHDLDTLVKLNQILSRIEAAEDTLLELNICPKCGGKIGTTQKNIGGNTEDDPEPRGIFYRVGCQNCDYLIESEYIDI